MTNNPDLPNTWGIPDDQAKKVREALSKKPIRPENAVQKAVEELARDIAIIEPDPEDWGWWVGYLLEQMEVEAKRKGRQADFEQFLELLRKDLDI